MAIRDALLEFSSAQAVTASAVSTNAVDLGVSYDIGPGEPLYLSIVVPTNFAGLTGLQVVLQTSSDGSTFTDLLASKVYSLDELNNGKQKVLPIPQGCGRYLQLDYVVTGAGTAGAITAGIVLNEVQYTAFGVGSIDNWKPPEVEESSESFEESSEESSGS